MLAFKQSSFSICWAISHLRRPGRVRRTCAVSAASCIQLRFQLLVHFFNAI
jgi:hypothetical protein